jgi:hypothetical protein
MASVEDNGKFLRRKIGKMHRSHPDRADGTMVRAALPVQVLLFGWTVAVMPDRRGG